MEFIIRERRGIIASELIFLFFFVCWIAYRAYDPAIDHTEQPMDFALLNASIATTTGPPEDLWLRGQSVSYYYFGHWMMGVLTQMSGIASSVSYNLSMALVPAMASMGIFGLVYNMVRADSTRWRYALTAGLFSVMFMGLISNLTGFLEFIRTIGMGSHAFWDWIRIEGMDGLSHNISKSWVPQEIWWWFRDTRVINTFVEDVQLDYTIQEFPFFSFVLGDLHPHVMSIPIVILFIYFVWNFYRTPLPIWGRIDTRMVASLLVMSLILGGLAFTNVWDLPTCAAIFLGMNVLRNYFINRVSTWTMMRDTILIGMVVIVLAVVLFLPFWSNFRPGVSGVGVVTGTASRPVHLFIIWALFIASVTPLIIFSFCQTVVRSDWRRLILYGVMIALTPYLIWALMYAGTMSELVDRFFHVLPFIVLIILAVYSALWYTRWRGPSGRAFSLGLVAFGLLLIMGPELLFVDDSFGIPFERMNTMFKLYYQAWIILSIVSGFSVYHWLSSLKTLPSWGKTLSILWAGIFIALLVGSLYYAPAAASSKADFFKRDPTLDGLSFVAKQRPAEYEAINYLRHHSSNGSAILEAVGEWSDYGLISRSTGIPTVFNWPGHQVQWRGSTEEFSIRENDVAQIYQTSSVEEAKNLLFKYDVDFVYVGPREIQAYGTGDLAKFSRFMKIVFLQDDVVIYEILE